MGYEVVATAEFDALLDEAVAFRMDNYGRRSARRLLDAVDKVGNLLSSTPRMGSQVDGEADVSEADALRWVKIDSYIAVYRVQDDKRRVALLKLFYGSSNWRRRVL